MNCKFCNGPLSEDSAVCPACGAAVEKEEQTPVEQTEVAAEETVSLSQNEELDAVEETVAPARSEEADEVPEQEDTPYVEQQTPVKVKKRWPAVLGAIAATAGLMLLAGLLVVTVLIALGVKIELPENSIFTKKENNILYQEVYTETDENAVEKADEVIAQIGDAKLTNAQLQIYYRMQVLDFLNNYSYYLQQIGLDYTQPLSEQTSYYDETMTWEQYFIDISIQTWQNFQTLALEAEKAGFAMDEELLTELEGIPAALEEEAKAGEYESADAMIKELLGPGCTMEDYMEYIRVNAIANEYYASEYEKLVPTEEEAETYFNENEATFAEGGVTVESGLVSSVRHILVCPKGGTTDEQTGATTYTDEEWAACLANAEEILQKWKDGEATEESFAAMVAEYTEDPGSKETGGLYENVNPTSSFVENFLNWSVDMARKSGDTGIVQTEYGYHIMYFVDGSPYWKSVAQEQLLVERTSQFVEDVKEAWPMEVTYKSIVLAELKLS